jgi:hypothetical protein
MRFAPTETGTYTFEIHAVDGAGTATPSSSMAFNSASGTKKGYIRQANKHYLKFDNNDTYFPIGSGNQLPNPVTLTLPTATCVYPSPSPPEPYQVCDIASPEEYCTVEYEVYLDRLFTQNVNYTRLVFSTQGVGIFGYDYNLNRCFYKNFLFNDPTAGNTSQNSYGINLKDAWQLDFILRVCERNGIYVQLGLWNSGDICYKDYDQWAHNTWNHSCFNANGFDELYNPYPSTNVVLSCDNPYKFFSDGTARQVQKNMIRYIVSRWGYSTNILTWELMNEMQWLYVGNIDNYPSPRWTTPTTFDSDVLGWVTDISSYIKSIDPNKHMVMTDYDPTNCPNDLNADPNGHDYTVTPGCFLPTRRLVNEIDKVSDFSTNHLYQGYLDCNWPGSENHFVWAQRYNNVYSKPFFVSEWSDSDPMKMVNYDPRGFFFHDVSWSAGFSSAMGVPSTCWLDVYTINPSINLDYTFNALYQYWNGVKLDQDDNIQYYDNNVTSSGNYCTSAAIVNNGCPPSPPPYFSPGSKLKCYYFTKNKKEFYGWAVDPNFSIEAISNNAATASYATSSSGTRPTPIVNPFVQINNILPGDYSVTWYNTATGAVYGQEIFNTTTNTLTISSSLLTSKIADPSNIFGDIAFKAVRDCHTQDCGWNETSFNILANPASLTTGMASSADKSSFYYVDNTGKLINMYFNNTWQFSVIPTYTTVLASSGIVTDNVGVGRIYYVGTDRRVYVATYNLISQTWSSTMISGSFQVAISSAAKLSLDPSGNVYFAALPSRLVQIPVSGGGFGRVT